MTTNKEQWERLRLLQQLGIVAGAGVLSVMAYMYVAASKPAMLRDVETLQYQKTVIYDVERSVEKPMGEVTSALDEKIALIISAPDYVPQIQSYRAKQRRAAGVQIGLACLALYGVMRMKR